MFKTTVNVEGMMCGNCEKHVNEAVKKNFSVKDVKSSHDENKTEIISAEKLDPEKLKSVIEEAGYKFTGLTDEPYEKKGFNLFGKKQ